MIDVTTDKLTSETGANSWIDFLRRGIDNFGDLQN